MGDAATACDACGYALSADERSGAGAAGGSPLPPPVPRPPSRPLPTLSQPARVVVVEQTAHEPYWVGAPSAHDVADEVHHVTVGRVRAARQANAMAYPAALAAAAAVVATIPVVVDIRTAVAVAAAGDYHLVDLFTNNIGAMVAAAIALAIGASLRTRLDGFGVGLAGGAGVALAAFVAFLYGRTRVVETVAATDVTGGATAHYELGAWVLLAAGVLGIVTALVAAVPAGRDSPRRRTDLLVALAGVLGALALAAGPLLPVDGARLADNWSTDAAPGAFVVTRLVVLGVLALTGVVGFASRRLWGIGLALGGMSIAGWQWLSSFAQIGDAPAGVGGRNPVASDSVPHAVTTAGFALALLACVCALIRSRRAAPA
jgi:hypothetical protein